MADLRRFYSGVFLSGRNRIVILSAPVCRGFVTGAQIVKFASTSIDNNTVKL
jgi:hypothetical protein